MNASLKDQVAQTSAWIGKLREEIAHVIVGQEQLVDRLLVGLLANGHVLLEGVPGLAKTLSARTLAAAVQADFRRIQFTPDLLPADILGTLIYNPQDGKYHVTRGPIFANFVLADEINRAPAKVQSALLEAMQERQVTLSDTTFPLDAPFWVLATQNPVEQEGVYTLPEAQLDRFSMMLRVGYPSAGEEIDMLHVRMTETQIDPQVSPADVNVLREFIRASVFIDPKIIEYIVRLGRSTRTPEDVGRGDLKELLLLGISPRSYQHILALARVTAFMHGRTWVLPEDVKELFCDTARHRIARTVRAQAENIEADEILTELLRAVPIP